MKFVDSEFPIVVVSVAMSVVVSVVASDVHNVFFVVVCTELSSFCVPFVGDVDEVSSFPVCVVKAVVESIVVNDSCVVGLASMLMGNG